MFKSEIAINQFLCSMVAKIVQDIDDSVLYEHSAGHGHTPVWVLGHLAITAELGQHLLGGSVTHPKWVKMFGPGSKDEPELLLNSGERFDRSNLMEALDIGYTKLRDLASQATDPGQIERPHGVALLANTPIQSVADLVTHLLTSHFGFHISQLSSVRRVAGHGPLL